MNLNARAAGILLAFVITGVSSQGAEVTQTNRPVPNEEGRYRSALLFASVVELIRDEYLELEKTDYDKMTYSALRGLLTSLDPHSQFLDPEHYKMIRTETEGQFGGLGISVGMVENQLTVNVPIEGGPGYRAGLLPGDRITKIDGKGTQKLSLGESIRLLRGPGVPVQIAIYRPSESKTIELSVIREMIQVPTLQETKMISAAESQGEKIGYVRITQFGEKTGKEFDGAIGKLEKDGATALILDLRDNPGGLVDAAVEVVSRFVPKGTLVVATEGRKAGAKRQEYLSREAALRVRWPTVVLVNGNTASAAEIVAGALQDLGLAVIVGETTFGKGSVQTVQRVDPSVIPDVGVRLTTAHYTTPSRKKIHGVGIQPDVVARLTRAEEEAIFQKRSPGLKKSSEEELEVNDEPLDRAIDLLRGWKVVKRRAVSDRSS